MSHVEELVNWSKRRKEKRIKEGLSEAHLSTKEVARSLHISEARVRQLAPQTPGAVRTQRGWTFSSQSLRYLEARNRKIGRKGMHNLDPYRLLLRAAKRKAKEVKDR